MLTISSLAADALGSFLAEDFLRTFGSKEQELAHGVATAARLILERIGNSDALYHDIEHTMLVTLAGRDLIRGRLLLERTDALDWAHFVIACMAHDIGYVRGILKDDTAYEFVADMAGRKVTLPRGASDAALTPYHVDRSKMFVLERLSDSAAIDAARVAKAIEYTRFPVVERAVAPNGDDAEATLVRAADLIGQLGDPSYLNKTNALFCEFREIGIAAKLGYESPADLVENYPDFFWRSVSPHIGPAVRYLEITVEGRTWLAHLYSNVFSAAGAANRQAADQASNARRLPGRTPALDKPLQAIEPLQGVNRADRETGR